MLFASFAAEKWTVLKLISWKHSFKRLSEESEMAKKKKQALDNLLNDGRISQSTFEMFCEEIDQTIAEIEGQQKALLEKMNSKMGELEEQIKTLEILLANFEIQHVTGEVDEEAYQREISVLSVGLETARHELDIVREAVNQLSGGVQISATDVAVQQEMEPQPQGNVEVSKTEVKIAEESVSAVEEKLPEPPVEHVEVSNADSSQNSQEESQSMETKAEGEEKPQA